MRGKTTFTFFSVEMCCVKNFWKAIWQNTVKLKINTSFDLAIPLLGLSPSELEVATCRNRCLKLFVAIMF